MQINIPAIKQAVLDKIRDRKMVARSIKKLCYDGHRLLNTTERTVVTLDKNLDALSNQTKAVVEDIQDIVRPSYIEIDGSDE